jgi:hypothetical protein
MDEQPNSEQALSPDAQVAQRIVEQMAACGLIAAVQAQQLRDGLAAGTLKAADWRLAAENALAKEAAHGTAH